MKTRFQLFLRVGVTVCLLMGSTAQAITDKDVEKCIQAGIKKTLSLQAKDTVIQAWTGKMKEVSKGKDAQGKPITQKVEVLQTFKGKKLRIRRGVMFFEAKEGDKTKKIKIPLKSIRRYDKPGHFEPERILIHNGGATSLALFGLLAAGASPNDARIQAAIDYLAAHKLPGAYSRGLRANVWSLLVRRSADAKSKARYKRLLNADLKWLTSAYRRMGTKWNGWYHYNGPGNSGDHSVAQFAVLGAWACANAGAACPTKYWKITNEHWIKTQYSDGGWSYGWVPPKKRDPKAWSQNASVNMTCAGVNTLYVTLNKLYSQVGTPYHRLRGSRLKPKEKKEIDRIRRHIAKGLAWLDKHTGSGGWGGYYGFGIERLGVASGRKYIQKRDWYASQAAGIVKSKWGNDPIGNGFKLLVLAYGHAPVIFNKLEHGPVDEWDYYFRDIGNLMDYFYDRFEYHHNWQIVDLNRPLHELQDAPILYINGGTSLTAFTPPQLAKLRDFLDAGGTVFAHANLANKEFSESFRKVFEKLYEKQGYKFINLPPTHPVYSSYYGKGNLLAEKRITKIPLEGMSDGGRTFVFLSPGDIAGAWHQNRRSVYEEMFMLGANIRFYAAPEYHKLPGRLRHKGLPGKPVPKRGVLSIARIKHDGDWNTNPRAWEFMGKPIRHYAGIEIKETKGVKLDDPKLGSYNMLHITGHYGLHLSDAEKSGLKKYLQSGGFVLIDATAGRRKFARVAADLVDSLLPHVRSRSIRRSHPILQGKFPGGQVIKNAEVSTWARRAMMGPALNALMPQKKTVMIYSPLDLTAGMNGHFVYKSRGFTRDWAKAIVRNIVAWRFNRLHPGAVLKKAPPSKPPAPKLPKAQSDKLSAWTKAKLLNAKKSGIAKSILLKVQAKAKLTPPEAAANKHLQAALKAKEPGDQLLLFSVKADKIKPAAAKPAGGKPAGGKPVGGKPAAPTLPKAQSDKLSAWTKAKLLDAKKAGIAKSILLKVQTKAKLTPPEAAANKHLQAALKAKEPDDQLLLFGLKAGKISRAKPAGQ